MDRQSEKQGEGRWCSPRKALKKRLICLSTILDNRRRTTQTLSPVGGAGLHEGVVTTLSALAEMESSIAGGYGLSAGTQCLPYADCDSQSVCNVGRRCTGANSHCLLQKDDRPFLRLGSGYQIVCYTGWQALVSFQKEPLFYDHIYR